MPSSPAGVLEHANLKRGQIPIKSVQQELTDALESGLVVYLPNLDFPLSKEEEALLDPRILSGARSVGFTPATKKLEDTACIGAEKKRLGDLLERFSRTARDLAALLFPSYKDKLRLMRTALRTAPFGEPASSWRKDDTRLRLDAYAAHPTGGDRILRVFCNVNPQGKPITWRLGETFEDVARRFAPKAGKPVAGSRELKWVLRLTRTLQTDYDFLMLRMSEAMRSDDAYQTRIETPSVPFAAASMWFAFTDQVSHGVLSGQHGLAQTMFLPVEGMWDGKKAPLRMLERMLERDLD